jgi:hypothetical protein
MSSRRAILLDVDGVLIPFGQPPSVWQEWITHSSNEILLISLEMIRSIDSLDADVFWLTSWEDTANVVICPLIGWPSMPVFRQGRPSPKWWKLAAARTFLRDHNYERVAWLDDDLDSYANEVGSLLSGELATGRLLTLCPLPDACLMPEHFAVLRSFFVEPG